MPDVANDMGMPSFPKTAQQGQPQQDELGLNVSGEDESGLFADDNTQGIGAKPQGMGGTPDENYGNDFDAGVEANEEEDPEKYLQQLTGKLCSQLKKFNDEKPKPDAAMCKYIAGMVLAQCTKGLDEKEKDEILSKLTKGGQDETDNSENETVQVEQNLTGGQNGDEDAANNLYERILNGVSKDVKNRKKNKVTNNRKSYKTRPFEGPAFR